MKAAVTVKENYEFRRIYRKGKRAGSYEKRCVFSAKV